MKTENNNLKFTYALQMVKPVLLALTVIGLATACAKPPSNQKQDEITVTLFGSGQTDNEDGLPPVGPDMEGLPKAAENTETFESNELALSDEELQAELDEANGQSNQGVIVNEDALPANTERTKIALLLPLSAPDEGLRNVAKTLNDAALLALFDQGNPTIELIPYDTKGNMQSTAQVAEQAISEGADVILGPLLSDNVQAASIIAKREDIPMMSFNNRLDAAGNGVYILGNSPRFEVEKVLEYASQQGLRDYVVLVPNNIYGQIVVETAQSYAEILGITLKRVEYYDPTATDFTDLTRDLANYRNRHNEWRRKVEELEERDDEVAQAALKQLKLRETIGDVNYQAILVAALDQFTLRTISAQLSQYEVDQPTVRFLGLSAWDDMGNLSNEPPLVGSWYASYPDTGWNRFAKHYKKFYNEIPLNLASVAYEAVALTSILAGREYRPDFSQARLEYNRGYQGVRGLFRLSSFGYAERLLAVKQINKSKAEVIAPPPKSFDQPLTN
ncbi:penicillin-binding protein activator [Curvivirga sp.]|uniref:penicillin-binding protein activator n=1 Tax=Curvivirga sp. TaxID=2856848 RepID=UPI003B5927BC